MGLMGFYIPDPYHIGPESCGSTAILKSAAHRLKISSSPVKHCRCLVTQTKSSKIPERIELTELNG